MTHRSAVVIAALAAALTAVLGTDRARAYHELDCGPMRPVLTDEATGRRHCGPVSRQALDQIQRARQLRQAQDRRVRELRLRQRQRARAQELISQRQSARQQADSDHDAGDDQSRSGQRPSVGVRGVLKLPPPVPYRWEDLKKDRLGP